MGLFYCFITLKGPSQSTIISLLGELRHDAWVSPTVDGVSSIWNVFARSEGWYQSPSVRGITSEISVRLQCPAIATGVYDDDIFYYYLYHKGDLVDDYDSAPYAFDKGNFSWRPPAGGEAAKLCSLMGVRPSLRDVEAILRYSYSAEKENETDARDIKYSVSSNKYAFQSHRHRDLIAALGMPKFAAYAKTFPSDADSIIYPNYAEPFKRTRG